MEENNVNTEVAEELSYFDDGWGEDTPDTADDDLTPDVTETGESAEAPESQPEDAAAIPQAEAQETGEPEKAAETDGEKSTEAQSQGIRVKYLGREYEVSSEEAKDYIEKGMDYDRQKSRHEAYKKDVDELGGLEAVKDYVAFLRELAGEGGDVRKVVDETRASMLARREGVDIEEATRRIAERNREREKNAPAPEETAKKNEDERLRKDFAAFAEAYPEIKAEDIPKEVWDEVKAGKSLTAAWQKRENKLLRKEAEELRRQLAAEKQNAANKARSAPSMKTAGSKNTGVDAFDEGWGD